MESEEAKEAKEARVHRAECQRGEGKIWPSAGKQPWIKVIHGEAA